MSDDGATFRTTATSLNWRLKLSVITVALLFIGRLVPWLTNDAAGDFGASLTVLAAGLALVSPVGRVA
ncbi:MAG TPA: hypothetical protein PLV92_12900, partial [Pirellulaceae bacterium]|nr:hypothetical protein [Pirellulaceae bacterium]